MEIPSPHSDRAPTTRRIQKTFMNSGSVGRLAAAAADEWLQKLNNYLAVS